MSFIKINSKRKFTIFSILLFLYVSLNLLDGERGLVSYYKNKQIIEKLNIEKNKLIVNLKSVEKKNILLTEKIDLDYLEMLYREKFVIGKSKEHIYKSN